MPSDQFSYMLIHQINTKVNKEANCDRKREEIQSMRGEENKVFIDEDVWFCDDDDVRF